MIALMIALVLSVQPAQASSCSACDAYAALSIGGKGSKKKDGNKLSMKGLVDKCGMYSGQTAAQGKGGDGSMFLGKRSESGTTNTTGGVTTIDQGVDFNFQSGDTDWDECFGQWQKQWAGLGQYCETLDYTDDAEDSTKISAYVYTGAAIACMASCIAHLSSDATSFGTSEAWLKGLDFLCWTGSTTANVAMLKDNMEVNEANERIRDMNHRIVTGQPKGATADTKGGWGQAADATANAGLLSEIANIVSLTSGGGVEAARATSCAGGILTTIAAVAKWKSIGPLSDVSAKNCASAQKLVASPRAVATTTPSSDSAPSISLRSQALTGAGGMGTSGQGGGSGRAGAGGSYSATEREFFGSPFSPKFSAATAGRMDKLLRAVPPESLAKALEAMGTSLPDIANRLKNQSPSQVVAALGGNQAGLGGALASVDKAVDSGKFPLIAGSSNLESVLARAGGRGGAGGGSKSNPFAMFGMRGTGIGGGAPTEAAFEKAKRALASEPEGDIWHEGFGGTIFQIVSSKIDKTRDRIDQLEWDTPLNRALLGLPARKRP